MEDLDDQRKRFFLARKQAILNYNRYAKELGVNNNNRIFMETTEIYDGKPEDNFLYNKQYLNHELILLLGASNSKHIDYLLNQFLTKEELQQLYLDWEEMKIYIKNNFVGKQKINFEQFKLSIQNKLNKSLAMNNLTELTQQIASNTISINQNTKNLLVPITDSFEKIRELTELRPVESRPSEHIIKSEGTTSAAATEDIPIEPVEAEPLPGEETSFVDEPIPTEATPIVPKMARTIEDRITYTTQKELFDTLLSNSSLDSFFDKSIEQQRTILNGVFAEKDETGTIRRIKKEGVAKASYVPILSLSPRKSIGDIPEFAEEYKNIVIILTSLSNTTGNRKNNVKKQYVRKSLSKLISLTEPLTISVDKKYIIGTKIYAFFNNMLQTIINKMTEYAKPEAIEAPTVAESKIPEEKEIKKVAMKPIRKEGSGIMLGNHKRLYVDANKLDKNILEVRYRKQNHLHNSIKPIRIGGSLKDIIKRSFNDESVDISKLSPEEKQIYKQLMMTFGRSVDKEEEEELKNKFDVIIGEIDSGNTNEQLKQQLRSLLLYFVKMKMLTRNEMTDYFIEYNL